MPSRRSWRRSRATSCRSRATASLEPQRLGDDVIDDIVAARDRADDRRCGAAGPWSRPPNGWCAKRSTGSSGRRERAGAPRAARLIRLGSGVMPDGQDPSHPISVPDKPALEGLEAKWTPRWEDAGRLPVRSHAAPRRRVRDRHAAADGQRVAARRARVLLHPHRRRSRAFSACAARPSSIRWAGTTTGCRPNAGCRTTSASAAIRRCRTIPAFVPPDKPGKQPMPGVAAELHRALRPSDRGRREGLRASVALAGAVGRLVDDLRDHRSPGAAGVAAGVPAPAQRGSWPISSRRRRCGTSISGPPSRRPSSRTASSRAPITGFASPGPTAAASSRSKPPAPS